MNKVKKPFKKLDLKQLAEMAKKSITKEVREFTPLQNFQHKLVPIARLVVAKLGIEGSEVKTNKFGEEFGFILRDSKAEEIVRKLVFVRPIDNNGSEKANVNNRKPKELLWIFTFLTDEVLLSTEWETIQPHEKFVFDALTGIETKSVEVIRPKVNKSLQSAFNSQGYFLTTIKPVYDYVSDVVKKFGGTQELQDYLDYLSNDQSGEDEGSEPEAEPTDVVTEDESQENAN